MQIDLNTIAATLEGLEETIIHKLLDRAQFSANSRIYLPGESGFEGAGDESLLHLRLKKQEYMDGEFGRFSIPEERPFTTGVPSPKRATTVESNPLFIDDYNKVNLTQDILDRYIQLIPMLCQEADDGHYGSSVEHDVAALQAISRRIHYGSFYVAESKYQGDCEGYNCLIQQKDRNELTKLLTRKEVEDRILLRLREKVDAIQGRINRKVRSLVDPELITNFYRDTIIPLTKEGEIRYLLQRNSL